MCVNAHAYTTEQIAAESKRANEFFDKCWDENLTRVHVAVPVIIITGHDSAQAREGEVEASGLEKPTDAVTSSTVVIYCLVVFHKPSFL